MIFARYKLHKTTSDMMPIFILMNA